MIGKMKIKSFLISFLCVASLTSCDNDMSSNTPKIYVVTDCNGYNCVDAFDIATYTIDPQTGVITATTIGGTEIISSSYTVIK